MSSRRPCSSRTRARFVTTPPVSCSSSRRCAGRTDPSPASGWSDLADSSRSCRATSGMPWSYPADFTVARGLLRPGRRYADAVRLFEPYDRVREVQHEVRQDLLHLIAEALRRRMEALILVNNRLEGNAPGTIRALAAALTGETS